MSLQGKVALVTGASRGIGQAIALELGRQGAVVIGTATSQAGAERIAATLKENGIQGRKPYLTQYMGMNPEEVRVLPYMDCLPTKRGDRFLICSDGVSDMVPVDFLETMIQQTQSTAKCVDAILTAALDAGGKDNITAIVLEINR